MPLAFRDQYLTIKEVAEILGVHEMTVRKWVWSKKLPAFALGTGKGSIRISRIDLELLIETAKDLFAKQLDEKQKPQTNPQSPKPAREESDPQ